MPDSIEKIIDGYYDFGGNAKALEEHQALIGGKEGSDLLTKRNFQALRARFRDEAVERQDPVKYTQGNHDVLRQVVPFELAVIRTELLFHTRVGIELRKYCASLEARIAQLEDIATRPGGAS
jgi:hypothetical protein